MVQEPVQDVLAVGRSCIVIQRALKVVQVLRACSTFCSVMSECYVDTRLLRGPCAHLCKGDLPVQRGHIGQRSTICWFVAPNLPSQEDMHKEPRLTLADT